MTVNKLFTTIYTPVMIESAQTYDYDRTTNNDYIRNTILSCQICFFQVEQFMLDLYLRKSATWKVSFHVNQLCRNTPISITFHWNVFMSESITCVKIFLHITHDKYLFLKIKLEKILNIISKCQFHFAMQMFCVHLKEAHIHKYQICISLDWSVFISYALTCLHTHCSYDYY